MFLFLNFISGPQGLVVDGVMGLSPDAIVDAAEGRNVETARAQLAEMARVAGGGSRPSFGQDVLKVPHSRGATSSEYARSHNIAWTRTNRADERK